MSVNTKEKARYIILALLMIGALVIIRGAYQLEEEGKLTMQYAGIVATYLGVWGYIIKWFFNTAAKGSNDA